MIIHSTSIQQGKILPCHGKYATESNKLQQVPIRSLPLSWENVPKGTESFALIMQDYDAIPVCGFSWIHWTVANIPAHCRNLEDNASRTDHQLLQGKNSLASKQICGDMPPLLTNFYSGPRPPDKNHEYEITLFALDCILDLEPGFSMNELIRNMRGHVLEEAAIHGEYEV